MKKPFVNDFAFGSVDVAAYQGAFRELTIGIVAFVITTTIESLFGASVSEIGAFETMLEALESFFETINFILEPTFVPTFAVGSCQGIGVD